MSVSFHVEELRSRNYNLCIVNKYYCGITVGVFSGIEELLLSNYRQGTTNWVEDLYGKLLVENH
jgi:hypothetical protein